MLQFLPEDRISINEILNHKWLNTENENEPTVSDDFTEAPTQSFSNELDVSEESRVDRKRIDAKARMLAKRRKEKVQRRLRNGFRQAIA